MPTDLSRTQVLILCDHPTLSQAVSLSLRRCLGCEIVTVSPPWTAQSADTGHAGPDMVVMIVLAPGETSILDLARRAMGARLERTPLLLISTEPPSIQPKMNHVSFLCFPFSYPELSSRIAAILTQAHSPAQEVSVP